MNIPDNITLSANKEKKLLTIVIDYSKPLEVDSAKAGKDVYANLYWKAISDNYKLNLQLVANVKKSTKKAKAKAEAVKVVAEKNKKPTM